MVTSCEYIAPSWDKIYEMLCDLALGIRRSKFKPDLIVGVSRGGWVPARVLSDLLENVRTANVKIEFYVGIEKTVRKPAITQPISEDISNRIVLVVDDVADTGESLRAAVNHVQGRGALSVKTVTIYYKPHSSFKPDFFADTTSNWIVFPWERLEVTKLLLKETSSKGQGNSVRQLLERCGLNKRTISSLLQLAHEGS